MNLPRKSMPSGFFKAVSVAVALLAACPPISAAAPVRPNILFIAVDDLRPELGCYGDTQVKSPHIDQLAAQGLLFTRAYCQVPVCGASRASLMTSLLPTATRFLAFDAWVDRDVPGVRTMPETFRAAGYHTLSNGKIFHNPSDAAARSWSEPVWWPPMDNLDSLDPATVKQRSTTKNRGLIYESPDVPDNAYPDGMTAEKTITDLRRLKAGGQPFFLACGFLRPHLPFYAPKKYWDLYERENIRIAPNRSRPLNAPDALHGSDEYLNYFLGAYQDHTDDWHRLMRHGYFASASYTDQLVGDVLAELDHLGLADNTIVVLWGDHGWNLGEHDFWGKHNTMHTALRLPLIMRAPGHARGGQTQALVASVDIFPTLCDLAGVPIPASVQGRSFSRLLDQPDRSFRDAVYTRFGDGDTIVTADLVYTTYGAGGEMLYDHRTDPQENTNVVDRPAYRSQLAVLRAELSAAQHQAATLRPDPAGAR